MERVGFFIVGKPLSDNIEDEIFDEMRRILTNDEFKKIAFHENKDSHDILYTFLTEGQNINLKNLFNRYEVLIHFSDITEDVLRQTNINRELFDGKFKVLFENFLKDNLTIDFILDKINELGVESLSNIDYKILKDEK